MQLRNNSVEFNVVIDVSKGNNDEALSAPPLARPWRNSKAPPRPTWPGLNDRSWPMISPTDYTSLLYASSYDLSYHYTLSYVLLLTIFEP